jgi:hypothetical protein
MVLDDKIKNSEEVEFSEVSSSLAELYIKDSLKQGNDISIPGLDITIHASNYNKKYE